MWTPQRPFAARPPCTPHLSKRPGRPCFLGAVERRPRPLLDNLIGGRQQQAKQQLPGQHDPPHRHSEQHDPTGDLGARHWARY